MSAAKNITADSQREVFGLIHDHGGLGGWRWFFEILFAAQTDRLRYQSRDARPVLGDLGLKSKNPLSETMQCECEDEPD
jgi:hypothetical protein